MSVFSLPLTQHYSGSGLILGVNLTTFNTISSEHQIFDQFLLPTRRTLVGLGDLPNDCIIEFGVSCQAINWSSETFSNIHHSRHQGLPLYCSWSCRLSENISRFMRKSGPTVRLKKRKWWFITTDSVNCSAMLLG